MDYDENDFQNQNHHLAGEGNNIFPPVLNTYALPKFDFDDSLQGHLRFDSLVETEVFLGIESNEDSRWIEDFSRGSCGIDFNKSAADSCSVSRCSNVWSEATSSESVQMLLKSVGQEESIPRQTIDEVSDAFAELGCLTERMDPNGRHDATFSKIGDVGDLQPAFSLEEVSEDSSGLKNDVGMNQSHAEVSLQSDHGEAVENNSSNLGLDTGGKLGLSAERYLSSGETCINVPESDVSDLVIHSTKNDAGEDVTCSEVQIDNALLDSDSIIVEEKLNSQEGPDQANDASIKDETDVQKSNSLLCEELIALESKNEMNDENTDGDRQNMDSDEMDQHNSNVDAVGSTDSRLDGAAHFDSYAETMCEENDGRTVVSTVTEISVLGGDSDSATVQKSWDGETTFQACRYQDDPPINAGITDQSNENVHKESPTLLADKEIDGHPLEVVSSEQGIDSCLRRDGVEKYESVDDQLVAGELEGNFVASTHSVDDKVVEGDADRGRTCISVEAKMDTVAANTLGSSKIEAPVEDSNVEDQVLSSGQAESMETEVTGRVDTPNPDSVSVCQDSTALLPDLSNKDGMVSVSVVMEEGLRVPPVSESEVVLQSTHVENNAEVDSRRVDFQAQLSDSHGVAEQGSVESAYCASSSNEQSLDMTVCEGTHTLETGDPESIFKSQSAEIRFSHEDTNTMKLAVNLVDLTSKANSCAEATISPDKPGVSKPQEKCEIESEASGDASKALESTLASASPLAEGLTISGAPEDGRDHRDSDQKNSDTQVDSGFLTLSVSEKEKGVSEICIVQDIGVSGAEEQTGRDALHVPGQKEVDASKAEKISNVQVVEASPSIPGPVQTGSQVQHSGKLGSPQLADKEDRSSKSTPDRKSKRASVKSARRESAKKGNMVKDARPVMQSELPGKSSNMSLGSSGIYQLVQPNEILHHRQMEGLVTKPFGAIATPPSSLPDLNSSAFPPMVFQQPFSDLQQMQLRAQILVYGSLISRLVPEEVHMVSAFGVPDGGRNMWKTAWQTCKATVSGQTPHPINIETPTLSRSADMASDPASKQTKVTPSPVGRTSTSGTPRPIINPMIPPSSPLWSLPTPSVDVLKSSGLPRGAIMDYQPAFPQLASHQTQSMINYAGHSTTWMSQTPFRNPWAASVQTPAPNTRIQFPTLPTESVQLTPVRESSLALSSSMRPAPPFPSAQSGFHPGATVGTSPSLDLAKVISESGQPSGDPKSKKWKKGPAPEDRSRTTLQYQSHSEKLSVTAATNSLSASVADKTPLGFLSKCTTLEFNALASPAPSSAPVKEADQDNKKPILLEKSIGKVKEARQQAEDAAVLAAAAVSHSQEVWNELDKKKVSSSVSVSEAKLASAAVAIAAAAAVAKAAAAAAVVASNAALQAKAMADEALIAGDCSNLNPNEGIPSGSVGINSLSSIIFAAKEAARGRVEAASAAAIQAENLETIVKAAELAAEAISQAGRVVTMGDPLSLSKLAEAGPEGFWKLSEFSSEQASKVHDANIEQGKKDRLIAGSIGKESSVGPPDNGAAYPKQHVSSPASKEILRNPMEDQVRLIVGISGTLSPGDKDRLGQKLPAISDSAKNIGVIPEAQNGLRYQDVGEWGDSNKAARVKMDFRIQEGSRVEVFKDGDGHKGSWFVADVMTLKDGKAYVSYDELPSIKGSGKLQEWVDLEGSEDRAPKIRIPHPMTAAQFDGSKKRRRAAIGSFTCSVGDKVDAWIQDSWWEGVVTDKSKKDETSVTVLLPVLGESSVVKAWHLRPSLVWNGREWIEWLSTREDNHPHQEGDTPKKKRAKMGSAGRKGKGKDKASKTIEKAEGSELLDLSAREKVFDIGKSNMDEDKPDSRRMIRSGLRKQGPGVIFGVPRPGKKRKFMEVSKHYVEDQSNTKTDVNDSVKLANYLIPRGTGPRGLKNATGADVKENEAADLKTKVPSTVRSRGLSFRTASQKYSSKISASGPGDTFVTKRVEKMKDSSGHVVKHHIVGAGSLSSSDTAVGIPISVSCQAPSDANTSKISAPKSNSVNKEKPASTSGKLAKIEEDKILSSDSQVEPRRSNRQIQPTSRLLEGLQSSLIISKVQSNLHDKGHRSTRVGAKGNDHR